MGGGIRQGPVVVLAVDLDQRRPDGAQDLHADRLVVDEGAGAPVRDLDPAQDQVALGVDVGGGREHAGRMVGGHVEHRRDLALRLALAHQAAVAAAAERQREGIEEDRLAGAGLPGQDAQAFAKVQLELIDQDDVADRELNQHATLAGTW